MKEELQGGIRFLLEDHVADAVMVSYRRFTKVMPEHAHGENVYEIHLVTEGTGKVLLNRMEYGVSPGVLYITGPGVLHEQIPDKGASVTEFGVYLQLESGVTGGELTGTLQQNPLWCGKGKEELFALTERILAEQDKELFGQAEMLPHLLAQFVIECIRSIHWKQRRKKQKPVPEEYFATHAVQEENAQLVIDEIFLYDYRDITLPQMAKRLGFSVRQTQRLLERIYGKTFTRKKLEARMSAAMALLQNSRYSITEISEQLGYSSMEHFSYAFAKYYGYVPSIIRKKGTEESS
ncbi:MAG: AraC family transcriptional regulator [Lachnospiraceae bacterium]|nr:AraC family transcriptional regulator [Lachnospiraceae bacterium]